MDLSLVAQVNASPDDVWQLFVDVERWPTLTASIRGVQRLDGGPLRIGSEAIVIQPRLPAARWRVTALEAGRSFTWETTSKGITAVGGHAVEAAGDGSIVTLTLRQYGPLAGIVGALTGGLARRYVSMELDGFCIGAESLASQRLSPVAAQSMRSNC